MNNITVIGRLTKDPDVKTSNSGTSYLMFSVAVDRKFKDRQGNKQTDFLDCKAFGKTADFIGTYFIKGSKIALTGSMQVDNYTDQSGADRKQVYIAVSDVEFVESKNQPANQPASTPKPAAPTGASKKVQASLDMFQAEAEAADSTGKLPFEV